MPEEVDGPDGPVEKGLSTSSGPGTIGPCHPSGPGNLYSGCRSTVRPRWAQSTIGPDRSPFRPEVFHPACEDPKSTIGPVRARSNPDEAQSAPSAHRAKVYRGPFGPRTSVGAQTFRVWVQTTIACRWALSTIGRLRGLGSIIGARNLTIDQIVFFLKKQKGRENGRNIWHLTPRQGRVWLSKPWCKNDLGRG